MAFAWLNMRVAGDKTKHTPDLRVSLVTGVIVELGGGDSGMDGASVAAELKSLDS